MCRLLIQIAVRHMLNGFTELLMRIMMHGRILTTSDLRVDSRSKIAFRRTIFGLAKKANYSWFEEVQRFRSAHLYWPEFFHVHSLWSRIID